MDGRARSHASPATLVRVGLALFVLAWMFGPYALRAAVPVWVAFLIGLGLVLDFVAGAARAAPPGPADRGPQPVDRERYGWPDAADDPPEAAADDAGAGGETPEPEPEPEPEQEPEYDEPPARRRAPPLGRIAAGAAVVAALAGALWLIESRSGWNGVDESARAEAETRFSAEASRIAGKEIRVECDEAGEHVGAVQHADGAAIVGGDRAWLTPERCLDLYRLASEGETRSSRTGRAIAVLAHEAWHLRGIRDEGTTECYALQSGVSLGRRLGLSDETARQLMRQQLAENARRGPDSFEYRVPPECRDGGELDLDPGSPHFP